MVILNVALPLELVVALYVLPLTFKVTLAFLIAFPLLSFKTILYFLVFFLALKVAFLAVIFGFALFTTTFAVFDDLVLMSSPAYMNVALYVFGVNFETSTETCPLALVVKVLEIVPTLTVTFWFANALPLAVKVTTKFLATL